MEATQPISEALPVVNADVLNRDLLEQYKQIKSGLLKRLIEAYLEEAPKYFSGISNGINDDNFDAIVANCHALKSCSGNLGVVKLSRTCQLMEDAGKAKDADEVAALYEVMGPQAFEAEEALKGEAIAL